MYPSYLYFSPRQALGDASEPEEVDVFPFHRHPLRVHLEDLPGKKQTIAATRHGREYKRTIRRIIDTWCFIVVPQNQWYGNRLASGAEKYSVLRFSGGEGGIK